MANLEPWNMFTNDFVAEETNEILTDDANIIIPDLEVKEEPLDTPSDEENGSYYNRYHEASNTRTSPNPRNHSQIEDEDDSARFEIEPPANLTEDVANRKSSTYNINNSELMQQDDSSESQQDLKINYEVAIVYICPACGVEFDEQRIWKRHMYIVHSYNTRHGLNFRQIDRLYHQCLECHKSIAMRAMENLQKHKFTHLPYRCVKCKICQRQYKYRQDLLVHLRMTHRENLLHMSMQNLKMKSFDESSSSNSQPLRFELNSSKKNDGNNILLGNEANDPEESEDGNNPNLSFHLSNALNRQSAQNLESQCQKEDKLNLNVDSRSRELNRKYVFYICPECGKHFESSMQWQSHIEIDHFFNTPEGLNFENNVCLECNEQIENSTLKNLQDHAFSHTRYKGWLSCKLCLTNFRGESNLASHFRKQHPSINLYSTNANEDGDNDVSGIDEIEGDDDMFGYEKGSKFDAYADNIDYLCPQCGTEFLTKKQWRVHMNIQHDFSNMKTLRFKEINDKQLMCVDCTKIITHAYGIQNAQQHRFTHMPYKAYIRCRICHKSYTERKGLIKHLVTKHNSKRKEEFSISEQERMNNESLKFNHQQNFEANASTLKLKVNTAAPLEKIGREPLIRTVRRETVRYKHYIFEIRHLEEYFEDENNVSLMSGGSNFNKREREDDAILAPKLNFINKLEHRDLKCFDCGSIFSTQQALRTHIKEEHEFLDYNHENSINGSSAKYRKTDVESFTNNSNYAENQEEITDETSNDADADDLLVPIADEDLKYAPPPTEGNTIEDNYCYLCPACGEEFKAQSDWRRHINKVHQFDNRAALSFRRIDKIRFVCTICNDQVNSTNLKLLQDHKFRHLPYKQFIKCLLCSSSYTYKPNIINHLRSRHNIVDKRINLPAPKFFYNYTNYQEQQEKTSIKPKPMPIAISSAKSKQPHPLLKTPEDLISFHHAVDHATITYFCPKCNRNFKSHAFWRQHIVEVHKFNNIDGLNFRKLDNHHYLCLHCYKRVTVTHSKGAIGQLQSHKFRHLPYKAFKCLRCDVEFVRKQAFFKHLNRETNLCVIPDLSVAKPDDASADNDFDVPQISVTNCKSPLPSTSKAAAFDVDHNTKGSYEDEEDEQFLKQLELSYTLMCPQCGSIFQTLPSWREHIYVYHQLNHREVLNFKKIHSHLYVCQECDHSVSGNKLRDLQSHKFKHLPYGQAYVRCRYCSTPTTSIKILKNHVRLQHRDILKQQQLDDDQLNTLQDDNDDVEIVTLDEESIVVSNEGDANDDEMVSMAYGGVETVIDVDAGDDDEVEVAREDEADDNADYEDLTNEENNYDLNDENTNMEEDDEEQYLLG